MDAKTIDRIRALVRLAADERTPIEEARTAAVQACRLIVRHEVTIGGDGRPSNGRGSVPSPFDDLFAGFWNDVEVAISAEDSRRRWPDSGPTPKGRPSKSGKTDAASGPPTMITARSAGFCEICGDSYSTGERVIWNPSTRGISHGPCFHGQGRRPDLR